MDTRRAFKFRLVPTPRTGDSPVPPCRVRPVRVEQGPRSSDCTAGSRDPALLHWRASEEYGFLAKGPARPRQQALKNLDRALWEALDRTNPKRFPRFKRKGEGDSLGLGKTHAVLFVEDLKIRNMTHSARGTRQKSGLNRSILSQGWGTFLSLLEYKLSMRGDRLFRVDPRNTSRTRTRSGVSSADTAIMRTRMPRRIFSGRGMPVAPVWRSTPPDRRLIVQAANRSPFSIRVIGRPGSWQEGIPLSFRFRGERSEEGWEDVNVVNIRWILEGFQIRIPSCQLSGTPTE